MLDWGWCILFLVVGLLGLFGLYMCMKLEEILVFCVFVEEVEKCEYDWFGLGVLF